MSASKKTDTLVSAELRWKTVVIAVLVACTACSIVLLAQGTRVTPLSVICALACVALVVSNAVHLIVDGTTFGMIPLAVVSLGFAGASAGNMLVATLGLAVALVLVAGFALLRDAYSSNPTVSEHAALVVLGCAVQNGRPSKTLERRLERARSILTNSPDTFVIVTGGPVAGSTLTEADVMAEWLVARCVSHSRIFLERQARNTEENIQLSIALLERLGLPYDQVAVVSSDYHLWRARHQLARTTVPFVTVAAPTPPISRLQQWSREVLVVIKDLLLQG